MYRVTVIKDGVEYMLHDIHSEDEQIYEDELSETMGRTESFNFVLAPNHPNIDKIEPLTSEIRIYQDGKVIFFGRTVTPQIDIYNTHTVQCFGGLSYFADSMLAPFELTGSVDDFITQILAVHNSMVEVRKRFKKGIVNVAGITATRTIDRYTDTLNVLHDQLDQYGGYLRARFENGENYLDFVSDYGGINSQVIRFGENIMDISRNVNAAELITCLIPEGEAVDVTNPDGTTGSLTVNITTVNGGRNYIENAAAIAKWGRIWGYVKFEGVTDPEILLQQANAYLQKKALLPETIELTAFDLSYIDVTVESLKLGYWTNFVSKPHNLSGTYLLKKLVRHLTAPQNDRIIFGETLPTLTGTVASNIRNLTVQIDKVKQSTSREIEQKVNNATNLITGGLGGYVVLDVYDPNTGNKIHPWRILIMDSPDKNMAHSVIQINKNGIGFSTTGINGPYRNAWTINGNLVADFITAGSMLADRIRGGMLEVGGSGLGKDGSIVVKNAAGTVIGTWDKTGLHVMLGVIEGSEIIGASIIGGAINIGSGTFYVSEDGEVVINAGMLNLGPVSINSNYADLGAFKVSNANYGVFYSANGEIELVTSGPIENDPMLKIMKNGKTTVIGYQGVNTGTVLCDEIYLDGDRDFWQGWSLTEEIKLLHRAVFGS